MDDDVVGGVEGARMVVVQEGGGFMRSLGLHVNEAGRLPERTLGAQDDAVPVVGASVGHVVPLRASDLVAGEIGGREELDFGDDDGFVVRGDRVRGRIRDLVGRHEEGIGLGVKDAGFMEEGSAWVVDEKLQGWRRAEDGEKGVMVDEKGLRLRRGRRDWGGPEKGSIGRTGRPWTYEFHRTVTTPRFAD